MYKINGKKDGLGWKITLYKKFLGIWFPDTVSIIKIGYEYKVDEQINEWVNTFSIPIENVTIKE